MKAISVILMSVVQVCFGGAWTASAQVVFDSKDWGWSAEIVTDNMPDGFVRVELPESILDVVSRSLSDIRVVDDENNLVPHLIGREARDAAEWRSVNLINRTYQEGEFARVTLDFMERMRKNQVEVALSGDNYRRYAMLEGSETGSDWAIVDTAWLFYIRDDRATYSAQVFRFPDNDFRYMRLTVYNMEDEPGRIEINRVGVARIDPGPKEPPVPVEIRVTPIEPEEDEGNVTIYEIDARYRNLPLERLELTTFAPYFHRRYAIFGRDAATEVVRRRTETGEGPEEREVPWSSVRTGVIYRIQRDDETDEQLDIDLQGKYRYLRLKIYNADNNPLELERHDIQLLRRPLPSLVFDYLSERHYRMVYENEKAKSPSYDLAQAVQAVSERNLPAATLRPGVRLIPEEEAPPFLERFTWLIWVVLLIAVGAMGTLIARNLRHVKPE